MVKNHRPRITAGLLAVGVCALFPVSACRGGETAGSGAPCDPSNPCRAFFACIAGSCQPAGDTGTDDAADARDPEGDAPSDAVSVDATVGASSEAGADSKVDADSEAGATIPCTCEITDLTALLGTSVSGRVAVAATATPPDQNWIERIAARTPRDRFVLFQRKAQIWTLTDVTSESTANQNPGAPCGDLPRILDLGKFWEGTTGAPDPKPIEFWAALSPGGEFLQFMRVIGGPWVCFNVSHNADQLIRGAPERLTDKGESTVALGPDHDALVFRWGGLPPSGDDWKVRARLGNGLVGSLAAWRTRSEVDSFATLREDGKILVFRSQQGASWKEDLDRIGSNTRMTGDVIAWTSGAAEYLATTSESQHLFVFSRIEPGAWEPTDVTLLDGESALGRPARYEIPGSFAMEEGIAARNGSGHLIYHWRDRNLRWHAFDVSRTATGEERVFADPEGWAAHDALGAPTEALVAEGSDGRLLLFEGLAKLRSTVAQ